MNLNLWGRLVYTLVANHWRSNLSFTDVCVTPFRVLPSDLDLNFHMNNARYFAWMDIGRLDLMRRSRMLKVLRKNGWFPVVADEKISFGRSLDLFDSVSLETHLHGWDDKYFYIQQQFKKNDEIYAGGLVKSRILSKTDGPLKTETVMREIGFTNKTENLHDWLQTWKKSRLCLLGRKNK